MGKDIKNEAHWVLLNASTCGNDEQIDYFVKEGIIEYLLSLLQTENQCQDVEDAIYAIIVCVLEREVRSREQAIGSQVPIKSIRTFRIST